MNTPIRLGLGLGIAILMYVYLPVLELLEIAFFLAIGVVWALIVVDVILVSTGLISGLGQGMAERGSRFLHNAKDSVSAKANQVREDLAARVREQQQQPYA